MGRRPTTYTFAREGPSISSRKQWIDPKVADEPSVVPYEPQESLHFLSVYWGQPVGNSLHLVWFCCHTRRADHMTEIREMPLSERTLGKLDFPLIPLQKLEHL